MPGTASAATPYGTNLVKNPGAENGLANWDQFADPKTRPYGKGGLGYPSTAERNRIGGGTRMFTAGAYQDAFGGCGDLQQTIRLKDIGGSVDAGRVKVRLKGWMATSGAADLTAHIDLYFRDKDNHPVAVNGITRSATTTNEIYRKVDASRTLPKKTRILRVHLWASGDGVDSGHACEVAWDKISVVLTRS